MDLSKQEILLNDILENIAESLDISPSKYQQAVERYESVGKYLEKNGYEFGEGEHHVFCQGSFRLGTVVRPIRKNKECNYDIDLVCKLSLTEKKQTPENSKKLKSLVGNRLKINKTYKKLLEPEGRRCWTLEYAEDDGIGFHMDILPSESEKIQKIALLVESGVEYDFASQAIAITHKEENRYEWRSSNSEGFAKWFENKMRRLPVFRKKADFQKKLIYENNKKIFASVGDVPDALIRTPLQRAIQILKRHRDIRFADHEYEKEKPISMIITTLVAQCYKDETDIYSIIIGFIEKVEDYENSLLLQRTLNGEWIIPNPVNPISTLNPEGENFADRWNESGSNRSGAFFKWMEWLKEDLIDILGSTGIKEMSSQLSNKFGERAVLEAFGSLGQQRLEERENGLLKMSADTGVLLKSVGGIKVKGHNFYGSNPKE